MTKRKADQTLDETPDETPEIAPAFPPRRLKPRVTMWFVTEELVDNTWKIICHYRDYMEAHNAMRNFERQDFGTIRVSHLLVYEGEALSGKYYCMKTRDPLTPEALDTLSDYMDSKERKPQKTKAIKPKINAPRFLD